MWCSSGFLHIIIVAVAREIRETKSNFFHTMKRTPITAGTYLPSCKYSDNNNNNNNVPTRSIKRVEIRSRAHDPNKSNRYLLAFLVAPTHYITTNIIHPRPRYLQVIN